MSNQFINVMIWSVLTISAYYSAKLIHKKFSKWWSAPLIIAPVTLGMILFVTGTNYSTYFAATKWLVLFLGPATVAFAIPIYQQRELIISNWKTLFVAVVLGSLISMSSVWFLCDIFDLDKIVRLSLLPRSVSTPFAIFIADKIGGAAELAAVFVAITGIFGSIIGEIILYKLPFKSKLARGSAFGISSHAIGSNKAYQIDEQEGTIAALAMTLTGIFNILLAPVLVVMAGHC